MRSIGVQEGVNPDHSDFMALAKNLELKQRAAEWAVYLVPSVPNLMTTVSNMLETDSMVVILGHSELTSLPPFVSSAYIRAHAPCGELWPSWCFDLSAEKGEEKAVVSLIEAKKLIEVRASLAGSNCIELTKLEVKMKMKDN